jgi:hypothetical protein
LNQCIDAFGALVADVKSLSQAAMDGKQGGAQRGAARRPDRGAARQLAAKDFELKRQRFPVAEAVRDVVERFHEQAVAARCRITLT